MEEPLVSIIVPIYNSEKYLAYCIKSIIRQKYTNIEIILIIDGATDHSLGICEEFARSDKRIKVISRNNYGLVSTRKYGVSIASGGLIGFVDSDDWIESEMYEKLVSVYLKTNADLISSGIIRDYEGKKKSEIVYDNYAEGMYCELEKELYPTMLFDFQIKNHGLYCTLVNKLYKRNFLLDIYSNIDERVFFGEDCMTIYSYCLKIKTVYILKKAFYHYNIRKNSMCRSVNENLPQNAYFLYKHLHDIFSRSGNSYILLRQLRSYILRFVLSHNLQNLYDINIACLGKWGFQYENYVFENKIVIYGAGGCGQALYKYILSRGEEKNIVAWVDKCGKEKSKQCLYDIHTPDLLECIQYDYIIIAVGDKETADNIKIELSVRYKVEFGKIIWKPIEYLSIFDQITL